MRLRSLFIPLVVLAFAGCAAEHRLVRPAADARFPELSGDADRYAEHREAWTRRETIGVKGSVEATFEDAALGADYLAHLARVEGLGEVRRDGYFETLWAALYGPEGDRLPIQVTLRFERLFHSPATLAPERWDFLLEDDAGRKWKPHHLAVLPAPAKAPDKSLTASYRLWFLARPPGARPVIDGRTRDLVLHVRGTPGAASLRWKLKPANAAR